MPLGGLLFKMIAYRGFQKANFYIESILKSAHSQVLIHLFMPTSLSHKNTLKQGAKKSWEYLECSRRSWGERQKNWCSSHASDRLLETHNGFPVSSLKYVEHTGFHKIQISQPDLPASVTHVSKNEDTKTWSISLLYILQSQRQVVWLSKQSKSHQDYETKIHNPSQAVILCKLLTACASSFPDVPFGQKYIFNEKHMLCQKRWALQDK